MKLNEVGGKERIYKGKSWNKEVAEAEVATWRGLQKSRRLQTKKSPQVYEKQDIKCESQEQNQAGENEGERGKQFICHFSSRKC